MTAKLYFSNSVGLLLDRLDWATAQGDPFLPVRIATPTAGLRRLVQMGLAERRGIAAMLDFPLLERALWDCLAALDQERQVTGRKPARLIDDETLQAFILTLLWENPPGEAAAYLQGGSTVTRSRKTKQLAVQLAGFFREYEYSRVSEHGRQGLATAWREGEDCFSRAWGKTKSAAPKRVVQLEHWQKEIYHRLFGPGGLRDALGEANQQYVYTLPQFAEMVLSQRRAAPLAAPLAPPPSELHLFGLAQISPFHRTLIRNLSDTQKLPGETTRFFIYMLNPCAEYWEDALDTKTKHKRAQQDLMRREKYAAWRSLTEAEKKKLKRAEVELLAERLAEESQDNTLLSQWGQIGRENIQLWCQITDYDFAGQFRENGSQNVLATVQRSVLGRLGPLSDAERVEQDRSLLLVAAPEMHREIETIHHDMLARMAADPSLRPDDIAIALHDPAGYLPAIENVLGKLSETDAGYVPFAMPDAPAPLSDPYLRGLNTLMECLEKGLTRARVLALVENPRCQARFPFSEAGPVAIRHWLEALHVHHDETKGTGFQSALSRLLLGVVLEIPTPENPRNWNATVPYADGFTTQRECLASFVEFMDRLEKEVSRFRWGQEKSLSKPMSEWARAFFQLAETFLLPDPETPGENLLRSRLQSWSQGVSQMDQLQSLLRQTATSKTEGQMREMASWPSALFFEGLRRILAAAEMGGAPWLSGGVQIGKLEALRGLPFRVIYVPGLQEGDFPDEPLHSSLDLRQYRRVIGDIEPAARNRWHLLMALMQAQEALILSYVNRDLQRDRVIQASSVITELKGYLEADILTQHQGYSSSYRILQVTLEPGLPGDPLLAPDPFPEERLLAQQIVHRDGHREMPTPPIVAKDKTAPASAPAARSDAATPEKDQIITLRDFSEFLTSPLRWRLRQLGLSYRQDAPLEAEQPFQVSKEFERQISEFVFWESLRNPDAQNTLRRRLRGRLEFHALRGELPEGHFGMVALESLYENLAAQLETQTAWLRSAVGPQGMRQIKTVRLGDMGDGLSLLPHWKLPEVQFTDLDHAKTKGNFNVTRIRASATGVFIPEGLGEGPGMILPFPRGTSWSERLRPFLFYAIGVLSPTPLGDVLRRGPFTVWRPNPKGSEQGSLQWRFQITPSDAEKGLRILAEDMQRKTVETLPLKSFERHLDRESSVSVWSYQSENDSRLLAEMQREYLTHLKKASDRLSSIQETEALLAAEIPENAIELIRRRFAFACNSLLDAKPDFEDQVPPLMAGEQ